MLLASLTWAFLSLVPLPRIKHVTATNFGRAINDKYNPHDRLACLHRPLTDEDMIIASEKYKCGAKLVLYSPRTGRYASVQVQDRGPYGQNRYGIDLAPAVTKALRANGWEDIVIVE